MSQSTGPLSDIKVIELGSFIAGPYGGQLLADMGADLIKFEDPGKGDAMRQWGYAKKDGASVWWPVIGRNKKSITVDLRRPEGQEVLRRLIAEADVLLENFRPGTLEKWGLTVEALRALNPGLIVARVSGYGQYGPYAEKAGFAAVAEAIGGMRVINGYPDRLPTRTGLSIGDTLAGIYAAFGILAALHQRGCDGQGQVIDVGLTDAILAASEGIVAEYSVTGHVRGRTGLTSPGFAPSNIYPTLDGHHIVIGANADTIFGRLAEVMGMAGLKHDPRFATHGARGQPDNQAEIDRIIGDWTATRPRAELLKLLDGASVPAGGVNDAAAVAADPHFRARDMVVEVETADFGPMTMQGIVPKLTRTPGKIRWPGARLGEHTDAVLGATGYSADEIAAMRENGVL
ncbi:CaiB/BaiF CoA transferase family protein [Phreatobacter stygius]|uniref:CoA transferase n=1 Tax=Phreatobacter stygius TaxID=1940610 RepID=A0A4D7B4V8_9HYPH|nr:CoA transferase [Phreatobacter stygius]QCI65110.1 CoA transferase [Phreatobacter stygius]